MSAVHQLKIQKKPYLDLLSGSKTGEVRDCSDRDFQVGDSVWLSLVDETGNPTGQSTSRMITRIQRGYGLPDEVCVLSYAPQPQPATHLTIPGALEWDGDNGTHGVVGTHGADGESRVHGDAEALAIKLRQEQVKHSKERDDLRAQLANTEQSRRSFFDLSQDLEKRLAERDALLAKCKNWIESAREGVLYPIANEFQGVIGHNAEGLGQLSVALLESLSVVAAPAKPKTCIECDQPYCHGVCVERGDQDYDRDQAAKGGEQ